MRSQKFISGVVEGFYGRPWSAEQRGQLFAWLHTWGMNTYLYAPKDDLKHRTCWRELYTPAEMAELKRLIQDCHAQKLNFVYALAPGLDPHYASESGLADLFQKARQLIKLGCIRFALLFDDIIPTTPPAQQRPSATMAAEQCRVAVTFLKFLREEASNSGLWFCPTPYCGRMAGPVKKSDYLRELGQSLDASIQVLWTGPEIISETIPVESVRELRSVIHRKPLLWDNLHANDYDMRRLYLGPYSGRSLELRDEVSGILSNPNCEFEANFVPLRTLGLFAQAQSAWQPREAYLAGLREWLSAWPMAPSPAGASPSTDRITLQDLELLGDCFYLPYGLGQRGASLLADFQHLLKTPPSAWGKEHSRFLADCLAIDLLFEKMTALVNRDLLHTFYRHVWELKEEVHLLAGYLHWLQGKPNPKKAFTSADHRPKIYRGGLVSALQRVLIMDEAGSFTHKPLDPDPNLFS